MISSLYRGELMHARADHLARRVFRYPIYMAAIELGELPALDRALRLFSRNGRNLFALYDADYTTPLEGGTTTLITNLRVAGYTFNPVSFFLQRDASGAIASVVAEVNNTYGGRHCYALGAAERLPDRRGRVGFRATRELFVSPFLHGPASYEFWFDARPGAADLGVEMYVDQPSGRTFTARFTGTRAELTDGALARAAVRYPLLTAQVIGLIHYEAIKLRLLGVPYRRPGADHRPLDVDWSDGNLGSRQPRQ